MPASKRSPLWRNLPESFPKGRVCKGKPSALTATTLRHFIKEWLRVLYRWINTPGMSPGAGSACGCRGKLWVIMTWSRMTCFPWDFLSACTAENATSPPLPTAHTHTHTLPTPPGQQLSKLFRSGQKLEAIFHEIKAIVQHFGNLLCDPSDPTTPKRTCTFTTQWNHSATLPVRGFRSKCMAGTTLHMYLLGGVIPEEYVSRSHSTFVEKKSTSDHSGVSMGWWWCFLS